MRAIIATARLVPEPSGAVAAAALLFTLEQLSPYRKAVAHRQWRQCRPWTTLAQVLTEICP